MTWPKFPGIREGMKKSRANGKQKGKRGELELAAMLRKFGLEARRGQQFSGASGDADVVTNLPWLHVEVKRQEALNLRDAMEQACRDATAAPGSPRTAVVFHRSNRTPWLATMPLEALLGLLALFAPEHEVSEAPPNADTE